MLTHKGTVTLNTKRLILRRFTAADADAMFKNWANDPEVTKFLTWPLHGKVENTQGLLNIWCERYESPNCYNWAIELRDFGEPIGSIEVVDVSDTHMRCEIGYCMSKAYWSQGIMSEALSAVLSFLFLEVGVNRIQAKHDTRNPASGRVMAKNGMQLEGILREFSYHETLDFCDIVVYSILRREFLQKRKIAMPPHEIIRLEPQNWHKCGNIWNISRPEAQKWFDELVSGNRIVFIYTENGEYLGEASLMLEENDSDYTIPGRRIYFSRLIVKASESGRGIGSALIDCVLGVAKEIGYREISVGVDKVNIGALKLYRKNGFNTVIFEGEDEAGEYYKLLKTLE